MSQSGPSIERPPRTTSSASIGTALFGIDLRRKLKSRKTLILFLIQLLPVMAAAVSLFWGTVDGLELFETTIESIYLTVLMPLAALFFGGPTIVDDVDDKTITYLTLRPISRTTLLAGKLASSMVLAVAVTVIPVVIFFVTCILGSAAGLGESLSLLGAAAGTMAVGAITYTAIFALLGVIFSSTLLPGIVYYIVFELIFGSVPIIEFLSVKFHLSTLGGFDAEDGGMRETLEEFLLDQPLEFEWWVGLGICAMITAAAITAAALVFRNRQFHV